MASVNLIPQIKFRYFNSNGGPLVGGKVYTYVTGTNTPQDTYLDATGSTLNSNPIILDSRGECDLYLISGKGYRITVTTASDALLETTDAVFGAAPTASDNWINLQAFGATGDGTTDDTLAVQAAVDAATSGDRPTLFVPSPSVAYKLTAGITINGRISMITDGMNNGRFNYTPTTGDAFSWTADGSYSYFKGIKVIGPGRTLGWTANAFKTYQSAACVFYVWEQCDIESFPMWGIDLNDSFACALRDSRIRQNGVRASLVGLGFDGQGGGMRLQRITFTGAASTGNDYTNCYFTGCNRGIWVEPSGSNNKCFNTRLDNCFFEENYVGLDIRNVGTGGKGRYQFLNTVYFEANLFAGALMDEGSSIACYQNSTTAGTGIPPSVSTDGSDGIVWAGRYTEDRPSRFKVGNRSAAPYDETDENAFSIDKSELANNISYARFARSNALEFGNAGLAPTSTTTISSGQGSPDTSLTANTGSLWLRNNGTDLGNTLYVKVEDDAANTGWYPLGPIFGSTASRPASAAATKGRMYYDTDTLRVVTDNGAGAYREYNGLTTVKDTYANIPAHVTGASFFATDLVHLFISDGARWRSQNRPTATVSLAAAGTTTFPARGSSIINSNAAVLATHTLVLPDGTNAVSGDRCEFITRGTITTLTVSPAGASTINGTPATILTNTSIEFVYNDSGSGTWFRVR